MKYYIKTFGCAANEADSERIVSYYQARGYQPAENIKEADMVVINTCIVRQSAEDRVYGLINNLSKFKSKNINLKVILTGCLVGMAVRDKTGRMLVKLKKKLPTVDEFLPIEEVGFENSPLRTEKNHALMPISNGCNNFCSYCVVPFSRGREVSRPFNNIIAECKDLAGKGYTHITLVGQNVNSYGADIINIKNQSKIKNKGKKIKINGHFVNPVMVKHLGRHRIPTLFPYLLEEICKIKGINLVDFISSNPWDFSDDLIDVIAKNIKISRHIHLPVQAGDNEILRRMNRWYTREEYLTLISKLRAQISNITISTDIIVGFPGETEKQFLNTVDLAKKVGFTKAYVAMYSDRPMTAAHSVMSDDIPHTEKKRRWMILEELINKENLRKGTYI